MPKDVNRFTISIRYDRSIIADLNKSVNFSEKQQSLEASDYMADIYLRCPLTVMALEGWLEKMWLHAKYNDNFLPMHTLTSLKILPADYQEFQQNPVKGGFYRVAAKFTTYAESASLIGADRELMRHFNSAFSHWGESSERLRNLVPFDYSFVKTERKILSGLKTAKALWEEFADTPVNESAEVIEKSFLHFAKDADKFEIWRWFEAYFGVSIGNGDLAPNR